MIFTFGFIFGQIFTPWLSDKYGRKKIFMFSSFVNLTTLSCIVLIPEMYSHAQALLYVLLLINGLVTAGRTITGYTYIVEFFPEKTQSYAGTAWNMCEGTVIIYLTLYFVYINRVWRYIFIYAILSGLTAFIISLFFLTESPKWLYEKKKYKECYFVLKYMASVNRVNK